MAQADTTESEEKKHLVEVQKKLHTALVATDISLSEHAAIIREQKAYLWGHRADMDHVEKISTRQSVEQRVLAGENVRTRQQNS